MKHLLSLAVIAVVRLCLYVRYRGHMRHFKKHIGFWPDPTFPKQRNEKYLWRRLFDKNPMFNEVTDKITAKDYALKLCPELKVAETLWIGTDPEDIPDDLLKGDVVIKASHGSHWNIFVQDGEHDRETINREANEWLATTYGVSNREWAYLDLQHRLLVEEMLFERGKPLANEYKIYGGGGELAFAFVRQLTPDGRAVEGVLDNDGNTVTGAFDGGELSPEVTAPEQFEQMQEIARKLNRDLDFVRVDLYLVDGDIYFSELTLYALAGYAIVGDPALNELYTRVWDLRRSWFVKTPQTGWQELYRKALSYELERRAQLNRPVETNSG